MSRKEHHVTQRVNGNWQVKANGAERASRVCNTKAEAIKVGRTISTNAGSELIIHGKDGKIQRADSHGNDPCPPRDKR